MEWKFTGNRPVYQQIMEHVRGAVLVGEYLPGTRIPPVRDFAAQARVNPNTMQRAMMELEREGILVTRGTLGRYVTDDTAVLERMRRTAVDVIIRACAEQFRALGLTMGQAAELLLALDKEEEKHG